MKIEANIEYQEEYLPSKRHRIPRIREVEETITVELREIQKKDAALALIVTDYQSYLDEDGKNQFGLVDTPIFAVDGQLYTRKLDMSGALNRGPYSLEAFIKDVKEYENHCYGYTSNSRDESLHRLQQFVNSHLLIDGEIYCESGEPRYVINTFGLGHNHGGTGMFIAYGYNPNISNDHYFNALQRNEALAYADSVASKRGDTKDIGTFGDKNIAVYMPEMIRCNPNLEHGPGNPLLNSMENLIQASSNAFEAGLLVMSEASMNLSASKPSLSEQIESADGRSSNSKASPDTRDKHFEL